MNHAIRLILADIDGTLVPVGSHEVSERVRNAVLAAESSGVAVVPVTGRPYEMAEGLMTVLGFDGLCVVDGGATIRKVTTGQIVWSRWLEPDVLKQIVGYIAPHCVLIDYSAAQDERTQDQIDTDNIIADAPYVFARVHKEYVATIMEQLETIPDIQPHLLAGHKDLGEIQELQVTHQEGNKHHGVRELLRLLAVDPGHTMAIGDGNNDLPLFESAGLKIAVGNAADALKAASDHIVSSVDEDGFAEAVERFVLHAATLRHDAK
jgi:Cof subfamily protein (haloacid dehalogenase superfamily)